MAKSSPVSVRLSPEALRAARELARRTSRSLDSIVSELTEEAIRMRQHPEIVFSGPPGDREARVEGSGLEVWQVISVYRSCDQDKERTLRILSHFSTRQLEAAFRYHKSYPQEIDRLIEENERPIEEWMRLHPHVGIAKV